MKHAKRTARIKREEMQAKRLIRTIFIILTLFGIMLIVGLSLL
jgi:hypothetical protein